MSAVISLRSGTVRAVTTGLSLLIAGGAAAMDAPHDSTTAFGPNGCATCHVPHGGTGMLFDPAIAGGPGDPVENLCRSCHFAGGPGPEMANHACVAGVDGCGRTFGPGTAAYVTCTSCHEPHSQEQDRLRGSSLGKFIRAAVRTPAGDLRPVTLTEVTGPGSYADGDATYDGICEVCHTATAYHRNGPGGDHSHFAAENCVACHTHASGFRPGGCVQCHAWPQGSRRVVASGGGGGAPDFERASHHVETGARNEDCTLCHVSRDHRMGVVRLRQPDDGSALAFSDGASLQPQCLGCHDSDGAAARGGTTPFTDGHQVPDIARGGRWLASAHATGGRQGTALTCYGTGSDGCHGNAHGSNLRKLLAPADGAPGLDGVNEEEGVCYRCHGTGGVIHEPVSNGWFKNGGASAAYWSFGADIQASFGLASAHPVLDSRPGHEFDVGTGPRQLECTVCHDVHQDGGRLWRAPVGVSPVTDPLTGEPWGDDPAEKIGAWDPAGIYQPPSMGAAGNDLWGTPLPIDGAGASLLTADVRPDYNTFCLSCHAVALAGTVALDWRGSKHGSAAAEPVGPQGFPLQAPFDSARRGLYFLDCLDCHEPHGSQNLSLLRRSVNGDVVPYVLTATTTRNWLSFCDRCHVHSARHHNLDVFAKAGLADFNCSNCHPGGGAYRNCMECHGHGRFF